MTKHTELPWKVDSEGDFIDCASQVVCQFWDKCEDDFPNKEANAEFIVRAVNAHEQLVAALRAARLQLLAYKSVYALAGNIHTMEQIDEALRAAGEEL